MRVGKTSYSPKNMRAYTILLFFVYNWWVVSSMPYERFLYIGLGLLVYICEYMYLKAIQNGL